MEPMQNKIIKPEKIRNIAIIAHVDHGKTTLVDAFLKQSNLFRDNQDEMKQEQILDSGDLEREKGITIKAKNTSIRYKDFKINIIDTPGHADFGGEVERTLNMADGCLLLVDAQEGPMPQTKFVLRKALEMKLKPMVVINKIDKKNATPEATLSKVQDLFLTLAHSDDQLEFPVFYAIARDGKVFAELPDINNTDNIDATLEPLLEKIIEYIPSPKDNMDGALQMQISSLEFDPHLGRYLIGKITRGIAKKGQSAVIVTDEGNKIIERGSIQKVYVREGLEFIEVDEAICGEIAAIAGIDSKAIGATLCDNSKPEALPMIKISSPSVKIKFEANSSPMVGKDGKFVTAKLIQQRIEKEIETNISLQITRAEGGYYVAGRGELQLSILIETMRREGYEFQVKRPEVVLTTEDGVTKEPLEEVHIDVPEQYVGTVTEAMSARNAELINIENENGHSKFSYKMLTRNLIGLRSQLITATKGNVVMNNMLLDQVPFTEQPEIYRKGVLVSSDSGVAMGYSLNTIQERGDLFVGPGEQVYEGMIIGINKYDQDMDVNPCKERQKSGVRMKHDEITQTTLRPTIPLTLEYALVFLAKDEILEVTPNHLRLRKALLTKNERTWAGRKNLSEFAKQQMGVK